MDHYSTCDCLWLLYGLVNLCKTVQIQCLYESDRKCVVEKYGKNWKPIKTKNRRSQCSKKHTHTRSQYRMWMHPRKKNKGFNMLLYYGQLIKTNSPSKCLICRPMQMKFMKKQKKARSFGLFLSRFSVISSVKRFITRIHFFCRLKMSVKNICVLNHTVWFQSY